MKEFSGKAGTIYVKPSGSRADAYRFEVWFEDFYIIGNGRSEMEALEDAGHNALDILELVIQAKGEIAQSVAHEAGAGG